MSYKKKSFCLLTTVLVFSLLFCVSCKKDATQKDAENTADKSEEVKDKEEAKKEVVPVKKKRTKRAVGEVEAGS